MDEARISTVEPDNIVEMPSMTSSSASNLFTFLLFLFCGHIVKLAQVKWVKFHFLCIKSLRLKSSWAISDVRWQVIASFFFLFVGFNTFGVHKNYDFCRQWIWFFWSFSISKCWQCTKMVNEEDESEVWCLNKVKSISIIRVFAIRTFPRQRVECNVVQVVISIMYHRWMYGIKQPQPPPNPNAADSFSQPPEKINQIKCWMLTLLKECSIFHYKCKHALAYAARANKRKSEWNKRRWCDDGRAFCLFARTSAEAQTFTQTQTLAHIFIKSNHIN